jgi:hypothetical protein
MRDVDASNYREQYKGSHSNFTPTRGRGRYRGKVTPARRSYIKQTDQLRQNKRKETMMEVKEALGTKLGVDLKDTEDALNKIEATKTTNAITLLVTTRTMGFCAAHIYIQASKQRNPACFDICAFYRINLAMFEARLYRAETRITNSEFSVCI